MINQALVSQTLKIILGYVKKKSYTRKTLLAALYNHGTNMLICSKENFAVWKRN